MTAPSVVDRRTVRPPDALLPLAMGLWWIGAHAVDRAAINDYGLLPGLPIVFFVGVALLAGSIVGLLVRRELSPTRLALHLVALVVVLHGTMPLVFSEPLYPWVYKHVGVVGYINLHGSVNAGIDIYHNWPGFFALAAWFTRISGEGSPLAYAAWAPVYFNLLFCLELGFVARMLPVTRRARWIGLFLFVAGNWVGQDYFAPQASAFALSLAVFGMVLAWMQADRPLFAVRAARRMASRLVRPAGRIVDPESAPREAPGRLASMSALFVVFAALVITHQLSPYVVLLGLGLLVVAGMVRPRWVILGLAAVAIGYLLLHLTYIQRTQDLFGSFGNPFRNIHNTSADGSVVRTGRRLTALAAPALILCLWTLALLGAVRRLRAGRSTLVFVLLALSPALVALGQSYGGEAVFRIYLFSLPWIALLGGAALDHRPRQRTSTERRRLWPAFSIGVVLFGAVALFGTASFGAADLNAVRPGEVRASQYFYDHARAGGVLTLLAPNFPTRVGDRYNEFATGGDNPPDLLSTVTSLRHRMLGEADLPAIARFVQQHGTDRGQYLVLSSSQRVYAEVLGLLPVGSMASLTTALTRSADWPVFYRNADAVIYRYVPNGTEGNHLRTTAPQVDPPTPRSARDHTVDVAGLGAGLVGLAGVGLALSRRRTAMPRVAVGDAPRRREPVIVPIPGSRPGWVSVGLALTGAVMLSAYVAHRRSRRWRRR